MRTLILAGVTLQVLQSDWDASTRPATLVVDAKNDRRTLERLTSGLRAASVHPVQAGGLTARVQVTGLATDKHRICLRLQPVETAA